MSPARPRKQKHFKAPSYQNEKKQAAMKMHLKTSHFVAGVAVTLIGASLLVICYWDTANESTVQKRDITSARTHVAQASSSFVLHHLTYRINIYDLWRRLIRILIPRPPGSENILLVKRYIASSLRTMGGWHVEFDSFVDRAPGKYGLINFNNIIASYNPSAKRKLILACHYDSKILHGVQFVGATDSAVPCAMMLSIARALSPYLANTKKQNTNDQNSIGLQLVFFDGEEAFIQWSPTDSIYGARHLANKWKKQKKLKDIDLFILLDLIGTKDTAFYNFTVTGSRWFDHAINIEQRLRKNKLIPPKQPIIFRNISRTNRFLQHRIEDDHIPFLREGVPIMHLITVPFPRVWHNVGDNLKSLDFSRIYSVTTVMTVFVSEYLHLTPPPPSQWWSWQ